MGERGNYTKRMDISVQTMPDNDIQASGVMRQLYDLEPQKSVQYALRVIEDVAEKTGVDPSSKKWEILAAESLFALNVDSWRLDKDRYPQFKRAVIDKFKATKDDLPANSFNIILFWMQKNKITLGARQQQVLKNGGFSNEDLLRIKQRYDRILRQDFSYEQPNVWYSVSDIAERNDHVSRAFIENSIHDVLNVLASVEDDTYDVSKLFKLEDNKGYISPQMYGYLLAYPGFNTAPSEWIRVSGNNGRQQDQTVADLYEKYKHQRIETYKKDYNVDGDAELGFYLFVQYQYMMGKDEGIAWFYNPQTGTVDEYFSQQVLSKKLFGVSPQKPKNKK